MSEISYSDSESGSDFEELDDLLQPDPHRPQTPQESLDGHESAISDSDEEVDSLENLRLAFDAKKVTKKVRAWFLTEDGIKPSTKFIDSRYPARKTSRIKAPSDLSQLFRKLAPSLPRHSDPIANGFKFVDEILKYSHPLKSIRPNCVQLSGVVMSLWKDVMAHPKLSKEHAVPGTSTNLLLVLVNTHLKEFRRRLHSYASSSLVTRSRTRAHFQEYMERRIASLRRIVSESRKKLGIAHKIHSIAAGPPMLQDRPTMCAPPLTDFLKALMSTASSKFQAEGMHLSKDFPGIKELTPLLAFLHNIDLDISRTEAGKRKRYDEDGDVIDEGDIGFAATAALLALGKGNGDEVRDQTDQGNGAGDGNDYGDRDGDGAAGGEETGDVDENDKGGSDGEGHNDDHRFEMNVDGERDGADDGGVGVQDGAISAGDVAQDGADDSSNGDGSQEDTSQLVEHTVKTKIDTFIDTIEHVTRSQWFDFKGVARFAKWRRNVRVHMSNWFTRVRANRHKPASPEYNLTLQHILIVFSQAGYVAEATSIAAMLVVVYREVYERDPSNRTKRRNLCNALGALSVAMWRAKQYLMAAQAAEDGIQIITPLYEYTRDRSLVTLGELQVAHSSALLGLSQGNANDAQKLFLRFRAQMAAQKAVSMLRARSVSHDDSVTDYARLARAIQAHMDATVAVSGFLQELSFQHKAVSTDKFGWTMVPKCCEKLTVEEALFIHGSLPSSPDARLTFHLSFPEEVVQIYRDIAATGTNAYDPFLAEALHWKAGLPETTLEQSLSAYKEGQKVYFRLAEMFPTLFNRKIARFQGDYALRLRFDARYDKADEVLAEALEQQADAPAEEGGVAIWRGYGLFSSLNSLHALVLSGIDQHAEALCKAQRAEMFFYATADETCPMASLYLAEPFAIKGYAQWMLGQPRDALKALRKSLTLLQQHEAAGLGKVKAERLKEECNHPPIYMLALGWKAGVEASLGRYEQAMRHIDEAVQQTRLRADSAKARWEAEQALDPIDQVLAHLLVIYAGILLGRQRFDEALERVYESLAVSDEGKRCSPSTYKTAIMLKARILEAIEQPLEAAEYASKANSLPGTGFMDKLQNLNV
ncbi:hypothetical protein CF326_g7346 [Tilletia indica]|nr:hypothetical protein CF326_g7346 [Tilletia indica]